MYLAKANVGLAKTKTVRFSLPNFTLIGATREGRKTEKADLSKNNTGRAALRTVLPVKIDKSDKPVSDVLSYAVKILNIHFR